MNEHKRKAKGKEKLDKCIDTVQKHLEQAYRIEIPMDKDDKLTKYVIVQYLK